MFYVTLSGTHTSKRMNLPNKVYIGHFHAISNSTQSVSTLVPNKWGGVERGEGGG